MLHNARSEFGRFGRATFTPEGNAPDISHVCRDRPRLQLIDTTRFSLLLMFPNAARAECLSWLFRQVGSAPYLGGGFGHFYAYAPTKIQYAIDRFSMEVKRQLDVLDRRLAVEAMKVVHPGRAGEAGVARPSNSPEEPRMNVHKNARLTPRGRALLVARVHVEGWRVGDADAAAGISERTAFRWLARHRAGGELAL
jgi:hypothetical protein